MWDDIPFKKSTVGSTLLFMVIGGVSIVTFAASHQNKKHGFSK